MLTIFPPDYPYCPDAPLLSFGPSFSHEISRSVVAAVARFDDERPHEVEVTIAAALTMLEAFHPRDQLECMMAAQGVGTHSAIMESFRVALLPSTTVPVAVKLRSNATQMIRAFSLLVHDLERRQLKPLPERPPEPPPSAVEPAPPDDGPPSPDDNSPDQANLSDPEESSDLEGMPEDVEVRPDGTPGSLAAYLPIAPEVTFIPREPPIMLALATRPKPWRLVNGPQETQAEGETPTVEPEHRLNGSHGLLALTEKIFTGDSLARFASARFDPDAPPPVFEADDAEIEIEIISTGGDPDAEAEREAIMAAHPEGKPIVTIRYGHKAPPEDTPGDG